MFSFKSLAVACGIAMAAAVVAPSAADARCVDCNRPVAKTSVRTVVKTRTVQQVRHVTRVKHVNKARYEKVIHRTVHRTIVQPVTRVNTITKIHHRTYVIHQRHNVAQRHVAPSRTVAGWSRVQHVHHRPVAVSCGCR